MEKIIKTLPILLLLVVSLQAQNTWISGGGGDTTGIVHNAIKIKGIPVTLIPPADNQILKFDAAVDSFLLEADNNSGGATAWDDITNPDNNGLTTITFDNAELSLFTGNNDAVASFFTIQNTDADHANNLYLLHLDYSADDGDVDADFIKLEDSGSIVMTIQQNGVIATDGTITSQGIITGTGFTAGSAVLEEAELEILDGATLTTSELNTPLDGALVTLTEFRELEAIGATTISAAQWTGLGGATTAGIALWDDADNVAQLVTLGLTATASEINTPLDGASVTLAEFRELETIGATTISAAQWTGLGGASTSGIALWDDADNVAQLVTLGLTATASEINTPLDGASVNLTEFRELETIGATSISAGNWTGLSNLSNTNTGDEVVADLTTSGTIEIATVAETNTGTDATRAVSPDGLDGWAGSVQVTTLGTIATGVWGGTAVTYANLNFSNNIVAEDIATGAVTTIEILDATITSVDFQTNAIDSIGKFGDGLWNSAVVATFASGADTVLFRDATNGNIVKGIISTGGGLDSVFTSVTVDSIENRTNASTTQIIFTDSVRLQDHIVMTTSDLDTLIIALDGVSATNSFVSGTRFFNYMDGATSLFAIDTTGAIIVGSWGATSISDGNVDDNITVTNYLLLANILDSLNNYDNDIIFTQGNTAIANAVIVGSDFQTGAIDSIGKLNVALWNTAAFVTYSSDTLLIRDVTDGALKKTIITTSGMNASAFLDSLNNYDGDIIFTQTGVGANSTIGANSINSDSYIDGSIDNEHLSDNAVNSQEIAAAAITQAKIGFYAWEKTIMFPDTLKSTTGNDTLWFGRNNFGATITVDSIYGESDVDNFDFSIVKTNADGKSPVLIDAVQIITAGPSHFRHTETTISSASVAAGSRMGIVLTTDNADYVTFIIYAGW